MSQADGSATSTKDGDLTRLMVAYQSGEFSAFEELYRTLAPKLRGYLTHLSWSAARTEDLLQETFLQIHRARHTYIPPRPVYPWVFAIARHVFLMDRRSATRRNKYVVEQLEELPEISVPPSIEKLGTNRAVSRALAQLNLDQREAVLLHHVWGFSFAEIGALLGIRSGTAKLRAHRALRALRGILSDTRTAEPPQEGLDPTFRRAP